MPRRPRPRPLLECGQGPAPTKNLTTGTSGERPTAWSVRAWASMHRIKHQAQCPANCSAAVQSSPCNKQMMHASKLGACSCTQPDKTRRAIKHKRGTQLRASMTQKDKPSVRHQQMISGMFTTPDANNKFEARSCTQPLRNGCLRYCLSARVPSTRLPEKLGTARRRRWACRRANGRARRRRSPNAARPSCSGPGSARRAT